MTASVDDCVTLVSETHLCRPGSSAAVLHCCFHIPTTSCRPVMLFPVPPPSAPCCHWLSATCVDWSRPLPHTQTGLCEAEWASGFPPEETWDAAAGWTFTPVTVHHVLSDGLCRGVRREDRCRGQRSQGLMLETNGGNGICWFQGLDSL